MKVDVATDSLARLDDEVLAGAFRQEGLVVAVTCRLEADQDTASGYRWSTEKGGDIVVAEDTLVTARIVTGERAPISTLIPFWGTE